MNEKRLSTCMLLVFLCMHHSLTVKFKGKMLGLVNLALRECLPRFQRENSLERFMDSYHLLEEKSPHGSSIIGLGRDKSSLDALERERVLWRD